MRVISPFILSLSLLSSLAQAEKLDYQVRQSGAVKIVWWLTGLRAERCWTPEEHCHQQVR